MNVVAAQRATAQIVPLYQEIYSQPAPDFESENSEVLRAIDTVVLPAAEKRGNLAVKRRGSL